MTRNLTGTELKRLHRGWRRATDSRLAMILDGIQGPFNVGAIIRTAATQRVERLWYANGATGPENPRVGKTAMGTDKYLQHSPVATAAEALDEARASGFVVVGIELAEGALPLPELDLSGDVCVAVGHEDRGLSADALAGCDRIGYIPQLGKVGSLNVATAAAIALYEVRRRALFPDAPVARP
ncbi:MAG: TrmH family RNA methyltransferase [Acidimicrobiales bacterium]